jgi:hypothetical protein
LGLSSGGGEKWRHPLDLELSDEENALLISPFSLEEIEEVVRCSDGNKCPGPDGFNFAFLKKFWGMLKGDFRIMFDQFHGNSCLPKSLLSYFVTLIPKVSSPSSIPDFRPISLLGCLYKIIAKVLAKRLALVMDSLISTNQSAFIKGRNLVDGVLIMNELVDWAKKTKKEIIFSKHNLKFNQIENFLHCENFSFVLGQKLYNVGSISNAIRVSFRWIILILQVGVWVKFLAWFQNISVTPN